MNKREVEKAIVYWRKIAERDYDTMIALFKTSRYPESLFFGHIVLEKSLKAIVVEETKEQPPRTHDLFKLSQLTKLDFDKKTIDFFDEMNNFNVRARYPEYKLKIYKICTKKYTQNKIEEIKKLYKLLCQKRKPKK